MRLNQNIRQALTSNIQCSYDCSKLATCYLNRSFIPKLNILFYFFVFAMSFKNVFSYEIYTCVRSAIGWHVRSICVQISTVLLINMCISLNLCVQTKLLSTYISDKPYIRVFIGPLTGNQWKQLFWFEWSVYL